jgi:hypothetical protein
MNGIHAPRASIDCSRWTIRVVSHGAAGMARRSLHSRFNIPTRIRVHSMSRGGRCTASMFCSSQQRMSLPARADQDRPSDRAMAYLLDHVPERADPASRLPISPTFPPRRTTIAWTTGVERPSAPGTRMSPCKSAETPVNQGRSKRSFGAGCTTGPQDLGVHAMHEPHLAESLDG